MLGVQRMPASQKAMPLRRPSAPFGASTSRCTRLVVRATAAGQTPPAAPVPPPPAPAPKSATEQARKYRRNVFTPADWIKHRSGERYLRHMTTMFTSSNVAQLLGPTLAVSALAVALEAIEVGQSQHLIPEWPSNFKELTPLPFTITGASLSLLLVFRTNASYGRWDEARKMWGLMVNRSRDIVRQANRWFPEEEDGLKDMFVRYMGALPKSMQVHFRDDEDLKAVCGPILLPEEYAALEASTHRPMHVMQMLGAIIQKANLSPMEKSSMDLNITAFEDVVGGCERIYRTPIPVSYTRLTSRFLIVYLFALPWCLVPQLHAAAIPACALTTFFMLGIEEIGVSIEEPFSILALEVIAETIAANARTAREEAKTKIPALVAKQVKNNVPAPSSSNGNGSNGNGSLPVAAPAQVQVMAVQEEEEEEEKELVMAASSTSESRPKIVHPFPAAVINLH